MSAKGTLGTMSEASGVRPALGTMSEACATRPAATGARASGFRLLGLDSVVLIEGFYDILNDEGLTFDGMLDALVMEMDSPRSIGLTRGGNHFVSEAEERQVEFDGNRVRFVGDSIKGGATPTISTTLLEYSTANLQRIIPANQVTTVGRRTKIRERLRVRREDYMKSLTWVRERADGAFIFVTLYNPMNIGNVDIPGDDNNEAAIPVTFTGFNDNFQDLAFAPYEIEIWEANEAVGVVSAFRTALDEPFYVQEGVGAAVAEQEGVGAAVGE